ncbi:hypothetical protein SALB_06225 [Streptomyces noursei]|uniref:Uncharacterized protein n=1 Tax=Streptomyces noursei TaxID=1971 RepID=A0A401R728_STRNR|nr:hypothetical protein SALB_06225 [Streptomyces noursei]
MKGADADRGCGARPRGRRPGGGWGPRRGAGAGDAAASGRRAVRNAEYAEYAEYTEYTEYAAPYGLVGHLVTGGPPAGR